MNKHGGYFGEEKNKVIDFSVNVNPLGPPKKLVEFLRENLECIVRYPEIDGSTSKRILSEYLDIKIDEIILGNGATEIIYLFARALKPEKVLIVEPTFTEYRRAFELVGSKIYSFIAQEKDNFQIEIDSFIKEIHRINPDVIVICNPNNPTGTFTDKERIQPVLKEIANTETILFTDESFIDFVDNDSYISLINEFPIFILRSMTKFFAIPGLRLGYGIGNENLISKLNNIKEPWTLNALALQAVPILLQDEFYKKEVIQWYRAEKEFLYNELKKVSFIDVLESRGNFFLCRLNGCNSMDIKKSLLKKNIYIRTCEDFCNLGDRFIRIAVRSHQDNITLIEVLKKL